MLHVTGALSPLTFSAAEYGVPTAPSGNRPGMRLMAARSETSAHSRSINMLFGRKR
jgi:hypothetical protein